MSDTQVLLIRHPETQANIDGRFVGRGNAGFTQLGLRQLRRIPRKAATFEPGVVWASPLERALVLAKRVASSARVPLVVDDRLVELDFGDAEGLTFEEIRAAGMRFNYMDMDAPVAPGGESRRQIESRVAQFCDELVAAGGRHIIVTHGGVFRASLVHLLGLASTDIWAFHIHNGQMAHVSVLDGHGRLENYVGG